MGRMASMDEIVDQNGGALVTGVRFAAEGLILDVEMPEDSRAGVRVVKSLGIEFDGEDFGGDAFEIFRLATELAFEVSSALPRLPQSTRSE